jgi:hypothetical protein
MKALYYLLVGFLFFSCNKQEQRDKLLQGEWKLNKITVFDYDGISYSTDSTCVGDLKIDNKLDTSFLLNLSYSISSTFSDTTLATGKYTLENQGEFFIHNFYTGLNNITLPSNYSRILFLSEQYFKWEFINPIGRRYHLIFEKK